jgi:predicted nucleic acid-binding protein
MSTVFADTYYFVALLSRRDLRHAKAVQFRAGQEHRLLTTDWVLIEVADRLARSSVRHFASELIADLRSSNDCEVVPFSSELFDQALAYYGRHRDKDWTLTDCTSFLITRERGIKEALTGDRHFEQAGYIAMLK